MSGGFTDDEINCANDPPANTAWNPQREYEEYGIGNLNSGPQCVAFMGRIVNYFDQNKSSKGQNAAKGCVKMIVRDDTGAISVKLWYAHKPYDIYLGLLVTIWTPHISYGERGSVSVTGAPLFTSIFPERDRSCNILLHEDSDQGVLCKRPLGLRQGSQALSGLMTLKNFVEGGADVSDGKMLVCVKSMGPKRTVTTKRGTLATVAHVRVFDDTAETTISLWGFTSNSVSHWKASQTILLITNAGHKPNGNSLEVCLSSETWIDVDPELTDAAWLRNYAAKLTRRECACPAFPDGVFDFETARDAQLRALYTLADLDEFARAAPQGDIEKYMGFLSMVIMRVNLTSLMKRAMLFGGSCCGLPLYSNNPNEHCKQCAKEVCMNINPRIITQLSDETGSTTSGKVTLSPQAWEQVLGVSAPELSILSVSDLEIIEQRLLFQRLTMLFGWASEDSETGFGRICIWEVAF
ncbi:hypothetical protein P152DRAFT_431561 [Eremomyces bilateralis CBS 781.70]|uniref:Nucleic acid-binding protein n=1 Tax=Eremomyces bilateralis CBS 781.70 TaxID=1392243 RepID=A0A6G1GAU9_9PEZI|nr:uncharacterized protein P152DRAFT_431561 [Eremomyces bilateralis CBS 781.70]KAF1815195.1 hypothetical protein P152DRAFT_431561 [Eremomyces bilateralis CBS 781.70]